MDLNKINKALLDGGIFKEEDDEVTRLQAIASAAREVQWARERKQQLKHEMDECCKPRTGDIEM